MSAIQRAITELQHRRADLDHAIGLLQRIHAGGRVAGAASSPADATPAPPSDRDRALSLGTGAMGARALRAATKPLAKREIRQVTGVTSSQVDHAVQRLVKAGAVVAEGETTKRRYSVTAQFDVVWDGTRDRAGTVPSLVGTR